ncbi:MAG: hypothetical protein KH359_11690 [Clostridiales bacterium]|nr:hypothetical protein [Proteus hauseri]MBS6521266.1 hypothetical protein [Clostridiales bacterium]
MKIEKILALVFVVGILWASDPVSTEAAEGVGATVGYVSSGAARIPGGNDGANAGIKTGDQSEMGKNLVVLGVSATVVILLALLNDREEGKGKKL